MSTIIHRRGIAWVVTLGSVLLLGLAPEVGWSTDLVDRAVTYAEKQRDSAARAVVAAQQRVTAANEDLSVAVQVELEARRSNDPEATAVAKEAISVARAGQREARQLLERAQVLLAARSRTADEMRSWRTAKTTPQALVVPLQGDVRLHRKDGSAMSDGDGSLASGDSIETGRGARAHIFVAGGEGELLLAENSALTIIDGGDGFVGAVERGLTRVRASLQRFKQRFEVRTPAAVTSVRGTDFSVEVTDKASRVRVFEGTVTVFPPTGGEAQAIHAGEELTVENIRPWPKPRPFDPSAGASPWRDDDGAN